MKRTRRTHREPKLAKELRRRPARIAPIEMEGRRVDIKAISEYIRVLGLEGFTGISFNNGVWYVALTVPPNSAAEALILQAVIDFNVEFDLTNS